MLLFMQATSEIRMAQRTIAKDNDKEKREKESKNSVLTKARTHATGRGKHSHASELQWLQADTLSSGCVI